MYFMKRRYFPDEIFLIKLKQAVILIFVEKKGLAHRLLYLNKNNPGDHYE